MLEDFAEVAAISMHRRILKEKANTSAYNFIHEKRVGMFYMYKNMKIGGKRPRRGTGCLTAGRGPS